MYDGTPGPAEARAKDGTQPPGCDGPAGPADARPNAGTCGPAEVRANGGDPVAPERDCCDARPKKPAPFLWGIKLVCKSFIGARLDLHARIVRPPVPNQLSCVHVTLAPLLNP